MGKLPDNGGIFSNSVSSHIPVGHLFVEFRAITAAKGVIEQPYFFMNFLSDATEIMMKTTGKTLWVAGTLMGSILAMALLYPNGNPTSPRTGVLKSSKKNSVAVPRLPSQISGSIQPSADEFFELSAAPDPEGIVAVASLQKSIKLPGVFRGDWGETPVYVKDDRVNHEGSVYLSLLDDNQDQVPALNPAYWQLIKPGKDRDPALCMSPAPGADLGECDFTGDLVLKDLDLSGANLSKARLSGDLGFADLSGANLSRVAVLGSLIIGPDTRIDHANLSGLQSDGNNPVIAESADMNNSNLSNANLYGARMKGVNLENATLTGAKLTGADLTSAQFQAASLRQSDLTYANLSSGNFSNASLNEANLSEASLIGADFSKANLQQANLAGADLSEADLSGANLSGANFVGGQGAETAHIDRQTNFTSAICPDGVTVDGTQVTTCVGHGF